VEAERGREEPLRRWSAHGAICDLVFAARSGPTLAASVNRLDGFDVIPGFAAEGARVHRERPTHGARDAGEKGRGAQVPAHALLREQHAGEPRAGAHVRVALLLEQPRQPPGRDHGAAYAAVADEQV